MIKVFLKDLKENSDIEPEKVEFKEFSEKDSVDSNLDEEYSF